MFLRVDIKLLEDFSGTYLFFTFPSHRIRVYRKQNPQTLPSGRKQTGDVELLGGSVRYVKTSSRVTILGRGDQYHHPSGGSVPVRIIE